MGETASCTSFSSNPGEDVDPAMFDETGRAVTWADTRRGPRNSTRAGLDENGPRSVRTDSCGTAENHIDPPSAGLSVLAPRSHRPPLHVDEPGPSVPGESHKRRSTRPDEPEPPTRSLCDLCRGSKSGRCRPAAPAQRGQQNPVGQEPRMTTTGPTTAQLPEDTDVVASHVTWGFGVPARRTTDQEHFFRSFHYVRFDMFESYDMILGW